jgi:hypothetical protein
VSLVRLYKRRGAVSFISNSFGSTGRSRLDIWQLQSPGKPAIAASNVTSPSFTVIFSKGFGHQFPNNWHIGFRPSTTMLCIPRPPVVSPTLSKYNSQSIFLIASRMSSTISRPHRLPPLPEEEESILQAEISAVEEWWRSPRWKGIKRPYSARDVATKRGRLSQSYPSSIMANKLFSLLSERAEKGLPVHTSIFIST